MPRDIETTDSPDYRNPRIDSHTRRDNAVDGEVRPDAVKIVWIGTMLFAGTVGSALTVTPGAVVLFVVTTLATLCLGHSLGMHRRLIHRSYRCPRWMEILFVHLGVLVGLGGPLGMLRTHDLRDWAQRQPNCHPYFRHSEKWYRDLMWQVFCSIRLDDPPGIDIEPEIAADPAMRFMERTWMAQQLPWAIALFAIGGWGWLFWGIASRVVVSVGGHWLIGYLAHNDGHRDWHVRGAVAQGYNVRWAALVTMGESWHNNHHAFPGSARMGLEHGQWDPGWWVLAALARIGLVTDIVLPDSLASRTELIRLTDPAPNSPRIATPTESTP